jgi:hypothetical protein
MDELKSTWSDHVEIIVKADNNSLPVLFLTRNIDQAALLDLFQKTRLMGIPLVLAGY